MYISKNIDVQIDLEDIDTDDLEKELAQRGQTVPESLGEDWCNKVYEAYKFNKQAEVDALLHKMFDVVLGRII